MVAERRKRRSVRSWQMIVSEQRKLCRLVDEFCEAWGGEKMDQAGEDEYMTRGARWKLRTLAGELSVRAYGDWIACQFDDVERAKQYGILSPRLAQISGKWNFDGLGRITAADAFETFARELSAIRVTRYILRMFRTGQTHSAALATWRSDDLAHLDRVKLRNTCDDLYCVLYDTEANVTEAP